MAKFQRAGNLFPDSGDDSEEEGASSRVKLNFKGVSTNPATARNGGDKDNEGRLSKSKVDKAGEGGGGGWNINKNYADRYDKWRNKEELMKMKARYGTDNIDDLEGQDSEDSSSSEEEWTEEKEKAFFKTLSNLKKKDPKIYDPNVRFFTPEEVAAANSSSTPTTGPEVVSSEDKKSSKKKKAEDKPFLLKDHERTMILEKGGLISDSEEEEEAADKMKNPPSTLSYYQELDSIKKGFSAALRGIESDDEDGAEDNLLLKRGAPKTQEEKKQEDEDYRGWLKGELSRLDNGKLSKEEVKELSFLRSYWNDEKLDEGEKFLRDYILNRKYVEGGGQGLKSDADVGDEDEDDISTPYNQIAHDSDEEGLSNDEQFEEKREEFEHKYNFRFEEPDPEFIKRFPRTIEDSLRREDESRKRQRDAAKGRRKDAKERKREEVQRLKAYKRKEILEKLQQLQDISGNPDLPLDDVDIDGDFDPEEYDAKMQKVFNDQYYTDSTGVDEDKPVFPYDPEIDDEADWKEWVPSEDDDDEEVGEEVETTKVSPLSSKANKKSKKTEQPDKVNAKEIPQNAATISSSKFSLAEELIEISRGKKANKKSKSNIFLEALEKNKPKFDPALHKSFDQYFKEYYALDFEDLIGDLPCRFKYRKVAPNDFGLSTSEILKAEDRELNQWASLKKTYQYRAEEEDKYEAQAYKKKAENEGLKKRVLLSMYQPTSAEGDGDEMQDEDEKSADVDTVNNQLNSNDASKPKKKKKKDKKKKSKSKSVKEGQEVEDEQQFEMKAEVKVEMDEIPSDEDGTVIMPIKSKSKLFETNPADFKCVLDPAEMKEEPVEEIEDGHESIQEQEQQPRTKLSKRQRKNAAAKNETVVSSEIFTPIRSRPFPFKFVPDPVEIKEEPMDEPEETPLINGNIEEQQNPEPTIKLSKRQRKNRKRQNPTDPQSHVVPPTKTANSKPKPDSQKKKKNNFKNQTSSNTASKSNGAGGNKRKAEVSVEDERLKAYGINPKKHKKWVKYGGGGGNNPE